MTGRIILKADDRSILTEDITQRFWPPFIACIDEDGNIMCVGVPRVWDVVVQIEKTPGLHLFPPANHPEPLTDHHVEKLAYAGVKKGHRMHEACQLLMEHHKHPAFHPYYG